MRKGDGRSAERVAGKERLQWSGSVFNVPTGQASNHIASRTIQKWVESQGRKRGELKNPSSYSLTNLF